MGYCTEAVPLEGLPGQVVRAILLFVCLCGYFLHRYITCQNWDILEAFLGKEGKLSIM